MTTRSSGVRLMTACRKVSSNIRSPPEQRAPHTEACRGAGRSTARQCHESKPPRARAKATREPHGQHARTMASPSAPGRARWQLSARGTRPRAHARTEAPAEPRLLSTHGVEGGPRASVHQRLVVKLHQAVHVARRHDVER
eukprot:7366948-Prymnesium_polylepis.1